MKTTIPRTLDRIIIPKEKLPRLANELRVTLSRRMALAAFLISVFAFGLHLGWSLYQRSASQDNLRNALARSLQEPLRLHDFPAVHAILKAFSVASQGAEICVALPGGDSIKVPRCGSAPVVSYSMNLSKEKFGVSVTLPLVDRMVLFGIPFGLAILATLLLISQYLKGISKRVLNDLEQLVISPAGSTVHYQELAEASKKIARGFQLYEENIRLAADAQIGAIAGLAGHDIRAPLETLQVIASDVANCLPEKKRRSFARITRRIGEVAEDLLEISKLTDGRTLGAPILWPPKTRQNYQNAGVRLASLIEEMVEEKEILYNCRQGLEIVFRKEPSLSELSVNMASRDLQRLLSNIINNAVEAMDSPGRIEISARQDGDSAELLICDTGCGISPEHLVKLMKKRESFGKKKGAGFGLFHAKETIESWGGSIFVHSEPGVGTTIRLKIPLSRPSDLVTFPEHPDLVLIDDDQVVHDGWSLDAEELKFKLASFTSATAFLGHYRLLDHATPIYIDKNGTEDGIEVAATLTQLGFKNLHLTTGERIPTGTALPGIKSIVGKGFPLLVKAV